MNNLQRVLDNTASNNDDRLRRTSAIKRPNTMREIVPPEVGLFAILNVPCGYRGLRPIKIVF